MILPASLAAAALGLLVLALFIVPLRAMKRLGHETSGVRYFGCTAAERRAIREDAARRGRQALPWFALLRRLPPRLPSTEFEAVTQPLPIGDADAMARARDFQPDARDVFVATQMKCGTTWMQQVVHEVMQRGAGDLGDDGHRHLYAASPWIEAPNGSVSMEDAPRLGPEGWRLIKTHLPTRLCPYDPAARYIYVTRHPAACFDSIVDFTRKLLGPLAPPRAWLLDWFLSDAMWWRSWPEHVGGWWTWAQQHDNVLFVHYEDMLADLPGTVARVADFLGVELDDAQRDAVVDKSGFEYMKRNEHLFEMTPPTLFSELGEVAYFQDGSRGRETAGGDDERARIMDFCREHLGSSDYPLAERYPA